MNIKDFSIPQTAGCYLFKDGKDQIIYVGKSKRRRPNKAIQAKI